MSSGCRCSRRGSGSYKLDLKAKNPPAGVEETKLGWYLGLGEWFGLTPRTRVTVEIAMHRTQHLERPQIVTANLGLAWRW